MNRKTTALVKDLELQIDFLIGYTPSGLHWKQEYGMRKELLENVLADESTPQTIREKINRIQEKLYQLQNDEKIEQGYVQYAMNDYKRKHTVIVNYCGRQIGSFEI